LLSTLRLQTTRSTTLLDQLSMEWRS